MCLFMMSIVSMFVMVPVSLIEFMSEFVLQSVVAPFSLDFMLFIFAVVLEWSVWMVIVFCVSRMVVFLITKFREVV